MMRFLFLLSCSATALFCQAEGRYRYASIAVKSGVAFQASVASGELNVARQSVARFDLPHPGAPGRTLAMVASMSGDVLASAAVTGTPELFIAVRAAEAAVMLAPGEWSAVMVAAGGGKARGLKTSFVDFAVGANGAIVGGTSVAHEAAVDDVCRSEDAVWKVGTAPGSLEIDGVKHQMALGAAGDILLATSSAATHPSFVIAVRRDRDAGTMSMRGAYALAEIGARNSYAFAPDQAKLFSSFGRLEAAGGQARISQRIALADSSMQFAGAAAYMVTAGAGTLGPRLEQRRRNVALGGDGGVFITAQVAEAGQLSLVHGVGIGLRAMEPVLPVLARRGTARGDVVSLYGLGLEGAQVLIGGQPAAIVAAWPNQINIKVAAAPASPLTVELDSPGGRTAPVAVQLGTALPDYAEAPAVPGGLIAAAGTAAPGGTVELGITGGALPAGAAVLFDGLPGQVVSAAPVDGTNRVKVTLPKDLVPVAGQVNVSVAAPGYYADLGDIAVTRPHVNNIPSSAAVSH